MTYEVSWVARMFHDYPHVDWSFHDIPNSFGPHNDLYLQSLVVWAAVPVLFMLLLVLSLLMYYCYLCCASEPLRRKGPARFQWIAALLGFLVLVCIAIGIVGNQETHRGYMATKQSASDATNTLNSIHKALGATRSIITTELDKHMTQLGKNGNDVVSGNRSEKWTKLTKSWKAQSLVISLDLPRMAEHIPPSTGQLYNDDVDTTMFFRWVGSFLVYIYILLALIFLVIAVCKDSRCLIIISSVLGMLGLIFIWTFVGMLHSASVAAGDLCVDPEAYLTANSRRYWNGFNVSSEFSEYYLRCDANSRQNDPFSQYVVSSSVGLVLGNQTTTDLMEFLKPDLENVNEAKRNEILELEPELYRDFNRTLVELQKTAQVMDCAGLSNEYNSAAYGLCFTALNGLALQLLASTLIGLLLFAILVVAAVAQRHHRKRCNAYEVADGGDESEAFLVAAEPTPAARAENGYRSTSAYDGAETVPLRRHDDEHLPKGSPPPEYNRNNEFRNSQPMPV